MMQFAKVGFRCAIALCVSLVPFFSSNRPAEARSLHQQQSNPQSPKAVPQKCETTGEDILTINCSYLRQKHFASGNSRIALIRASFSFKTKDESHMRLELTFANEGADALNEFRPVYLAIDDGRGQNHVRRALPRVDLTKIKPGQRLTFSETLLTPAFSPGDYVIHLWIPSKDPARRFDSSQNLLLRGAGIANPESGLNTLGTFTVASDSGS